MANALSSMGYFVTAICFDQKQGKPGFPMVKEINFVNAYRNGAPIIGRGILRNFRSLSFDRNVRHSKRFAIDSSWKIKNLSIVLDKLPNVDLYISFQPTATHILVNSKNVHAPIITMLHMVPSFFEGEWDFCCYRDSVSLGNIVTVLMPGFVKIARELFPNVLIKVMPNAVPQFKESAKLEEKKIVCLARLAKQKRVELLINSYYLIKDKYPDWVIEFYGETDVEVKYRNKIFKLCDSLGINHQQMFRGPISNVREVLKNASIFAFPSEHEGFGLALGEAMSMGLPVVGCEDCPAVNELIRNERNGLLVKPSSESFANALSRLIESRNLRRALGTQAKRDISKFSPEIIWARWKDLIQELTNDNK